MPSLRNPIERLLRSLTLLFALLPLSVAAVTINPLVRVSPVVQQWGWDIKAWPERLNTATEANFLYGQVPANLIRIPMFATAHAEDGTVDTSAYDVEIQAIKAVQQLNPTVKVFASLKLQGATTFPTWLDSTTDGFIFSNVVKKPIASKYAQLMTDYVQYMQSQGIKIDYFGPSNETDGALDTVRFSNSVRELKQNLINRNVPESFRSFQIVGPDTFGLNAAESYVSTLITQNRIDDIDIIGSHFYPQHSSGSESDWNDIAALVPGKQLWHTEMHMPLGHDQYVGVPQEAIRDSLSVLFASNKRGVTSFVWWDSGNSATEISDTVKREVIKSMTGGQALATTPDFTAKGDAEGSVLFQAYIVGDKVTLWIANPGAARANEPVSLNFGSVLGGLSSIYWQGNDNTISAGDTGAYSLQLATNAKSFTIASIPAASTGLVTFRLLTLPGDFDRDGVVDNDDYLLWRMNLGSSSSLLADANQNGVVDTGDYTVWRDNLGQSLAIAAGAAVPEPRASLLTGLLLSGLLYRDRRR